MDYSLHTEMMTVVWLFALIGMGVVCILLAYSSVRNRIQSQQFKRKLVIRQSELENLKELERNLRQELSLLQNKLTHVTQDPVTKLLGWQLFDDRLTHSIHESSRYELTIGLLMLDINDFKTINNALGNDIGDAVLREVAQRLKVSVRQVDSVSRFTKDTFVILLTQLVKPETAALVAQRILQAIAQPICINEQELYVTACLGISIYPNDGQDADTLMRKADYALHVAKEKGKQIYQFYQEKTQVNSQRELALSTGLRRESVMQEFAIYYQPIINTENNKMICLDALLHWQHPSLGLVSQAELFSYAEKQDKLNFISEWLLQNACRQFLTLRKADSSPEMLGIPLSIKQLENSHFIYRISQILQELQFNPEWILFEIKEHNQLSFSVVEKALNMLTYLNVKLGIEDFGVGPFSLHDLKYANVHYLKLDKSFIDDLETNPKAIELINSISFLAKSLSMQLVIHGVETKQQMTVLKELGCTFMQGKLFGPLLSGDDITKDTALIVST